MVNLASFRSQGGAAFTTDPAYLNRFSGLVGDLENAGYPVIGAQSGGYNPRNIAGTNTPSLHASGQAIDVNWDRNARGTRGDIDPTMARDLAKKYGLKWGGDWKNPDPMHFEVADGGQPQMRPPSQYGLPNYGYGGVTQQSIAGQMPGGPQMMAPGGPKQAPGDLAAAVAAYTGPTPEDVALQRKMALEMGQQASDTSPVGHWTQALARVLQGGISGMEMDAAKKGEAQINKAIADTLSGNPNPAAIYANPATRDLGAKLYSTNYAQSTPMGRAELEGKQLANATARRELESPAQKITPLTEGAGAIVTDPRKGTYSVIPPLAPKIDSTTRKHIFDAQDELPALKGSIEMLDEAKVLVPQAYHGFGSQARSTLNQGMPGWLPNIVSDAQRAQATTRLGVLMSEESINKMSATLKGATTDREMMEFKRMIADPNTSPEVKMQAIETLRTRAIRAFQNKVDRIRELGGRMPDYATEAQGKDKPIAVKTPEEARQLPKGTRIMLPDGSEGVVP